MRTRRSRTCSRAAANSGFATAGPIGCLTPTLNLFDRYLLAEWLKMLALVLAATMGVLMMAALYDDLRDLIQTGVGAGEILKYFATLMPSYLSVVLPLSMLLSLLFVLTRSPANVIMRSSIVASPWPEKVSV